MTETDQHRALHRAFVAYWSERVEDGAAFVAAVGTTPESAEALVQLLETARAGLGSGRWGAVDVPGSRLDVIAEGAFGVATLKKVIAALPPASPWAILAAARAVGRGAPVTLLERTLAQHAVSRDEDDARDVARMAIGVDRNIARFGGDAEKRVNALAEALHRGGAPSVLLQQIARAADSEGRSVLALDMIDAAVRLAERDTDDAARASLLNTRALVQLSFYDLDGCAKTCAEVERLRPGGAALVDAYRRGLGQPFEMWVRGSSGRHPAPAIGFDALTRHLDAVVANLVPVRRALVKRLGDRCPLPPLDGLSSVEVDADVVSRGGVPDLLIEARVGWGALCLMVAACGETTMRRPTSLGTPTYDLAALHKAMQARQKLLGVLQEAGTLGELDDAERETLTAVRWGGPHGVSLPSLPPQLAGVWGRELDVLVSTLGFLLGIDEEDDAQEPDAARDEDVEDHAEAAGELPTPTVLTLAEGTARFPQIEALELHPGLQADAVVVYEGDVDFDGGDLDELLPAHLRDDGGVVLVVTGDLRLRGEGGWTELDDRDANALLVKGDLRVDVLELCGVIELVIDGHLRARHIYVHHGDDGGYLNVGKSLRAESMLATTYFNIEVGGSVEVTQLVVDSTYAGDFASGVPHIVTDDDEEPIWERLKAGETLEREAPALETSTVLDLAALTAKPRPTRTNSFGPGNTLTPLSPLGWPLHVARIGDELVLAGNLGNAGNVVRSSDGASFRPLLERGTPGLRQVYGIDPATLLAVGEYGTVLKLSQMNGGIQVTRLPPPSRGCLFGVWASRGEVLVSGDDGVFVWRSGRWVKSLDATMLCRLYPTAAGVIAIGDADDEGPQIHLQRDGDAWQRIVLPDAEFDAYGLCTIDDVALVCGTGGELWRFSLSDAFAPAPAEVSASGNDLYALLALGDRVHAFGSGVVGVSTDGGQTFTMEKVKGDWWGACVLPDGRQVRAGNKSLAVDDGPFPQPPAIDKESIDLG